MSHIAGWVRRAVALGLLCCAVSCEPLAEDFDFVRQEVPVFRRSVLVPPPSAAPTALRVLSWNIKYAAARIDFWFDYWGDRVVLTPDEVARNLDAICALIRQVDPDIVILQEVEVNSRRSAYVDMVRRVLEHTSLNYAAYMGSWQSRYVPAEGLGRVDLGNAVLSKFPITFAERIRQPDRTDVSGLRRTFYLHRMLGRAVLSVGGRELAVFAVHTEAYDRDGTKARQLTQIFDELRRETRPFVAGGDFNELPPTAVKRGPFPDEHPRAKGTEFETPPYAPESMRPFYDTFRPWLSLAEYGATEAEQRRYYTHSLLAAHQQDTSGAPGFWNRTLDHLFVRAQDRWADGQSDVLQSPGRQGITLDPMTLSDHAPIVGTWSLSP